jgi:ribose/xylose/arabinose/galactoside ABC-type transport system permease subunit
VPWIVIIAALFLLAGHVVLSYTRFGRYVYMTGGNREAAEYSGVNVRMILSVVVIISAFCSGVAGMLGVAVRRKTTPICSAAFPPSWWVAPACSAARAVSATRSSAYS